MVLAGDDLRRTLNDDRRRLFAGSAAIAFVCECANGDCYATVALSPGEFDIARQTPPHLLLAAGHLAGTAARPDGGALLTRSRAGTFVLQIGATRRVARARA